SWEFPTGVTEISSDGPFAEIVFDNAGEYTVAMNAYLGECIDEFVKVITVLEQQDDSGGRIKAETDLVLNVEVSPNPNKGIFHVRVDMEEEAPVYVAVVTLDGSRI